MDEVLETGLALLTVRDYLCAICWGHLDKRAAEGGYIVYCAKYPDEHSGFVTKYYVDKRRQADMSDGIEVTATLRKIGVIPNPYKGVTDKQLLEELGFI